jgi:hypothetical protein
MGESAAGAGLLLLRALALPVKGPRRVELQVGHFGDCAE